MRSVVSATHSTRDVISLNRRTSIMLKFVEICGWPNFSTAHSECVGYLPLTLNNQSGRQLFEKPRNQESPNSHLTFTRLSTTIWLWIIWVQTFAALSDPTRRAMIERLSHGPASVHGLTEPFALSQQMISKHIDYLVRARIVIKTKRGRESVCTLRPEAIKTVSDWAISYRRFWEESFDKLDVVVNQMKKEEVGDDKKHG